MTNQCLFLFPSLLADGYWTILETVPYSIASAAPNQTLTTATTLSNGGSSLLTGATVVVELPPDDLGNPVGNIQYTIPALTKNATTNTNTTSLLHKPQATTIQIVKQQHHQQQHQQQHQHPQQQHQPQQQQHRQHLTIQQSQTHARQEYIKIDTSRLEDKILLRDVMQYGATSIAMAPQSATTTVVSTHPVESGLLLADADEAERELELEAMKVDQHDEEHLLDDEGYVIEKMHGDGETVNQPQEKLYINGMSNIIHTATTMTLQPDDCKYACNVCGKTYKIKGSLKRHKNYECGVEPNLKCPHCPHKCKYRSDLRKHMNQKHADSGEAILAT